MAIAKHTKNITKHITKNITKHTNQKVKINRKDPKQLPFKGIEFILLVNILFNQYLQLKKQGVTPSKIKTTIIATLKLIRKNNKSIKSTTTDKELDHIYTLISTTVNEFSKASNKAVLSLSHVKNTKYVGGFYFKNIEEKGDKPITGSDITRLLDEVQDLIYNMKYTEEGAFLQDVDVLISMLRGDVSQFKQYLTWRIFPKYYQVTPPFIKWDAFQKAMDTKKYEDIPDYLLAYQKYLRSRDEHLVEKGEKSPNILNRGLYTGFYDKLANSLDKNILAYQQVRRKINLDLRPVSFSV
uniref:Uncharacterized protein n=1 Tax=viral metagenome TaxID=1070528 RepID=A0A6C0HMA5_9ZZZZ